MTAEVNWAAMVEACRMLRDADASAVAAKDPEAAADARRTGATAFWALVSEVDRNGLLSRHYESKCEPGERLQRRRVEAAAHFLLDAGGPRGAICAGDLNAGLGGVAAYLIDMLLGSKPMDLKLQTIFGSGNREKNRLQHGAAKQFVQLVHYCAGLEGKPVLETLRRLKPDASEDGFNKSVNKNLTASQRRVAKNAGAQVKVGGTLSAEHEEVVQRCTPYLEDKAMLAELVAWAYREAG